MRAGDQDLVAAEQAFAFAMQVFVGRDIERDREMVQPLGDVEVRQEMARRPRAPPPFVVWRQVENRSPARGIVNPGTVGVTIVERSRKSWLRREVPVEIPAYEIRNRLGMVEPPARAVPRPPPKRFMASSAGSATATPPRPFKNERRLSPGLGRAKRGDPALSGRAAGAEVG